MIADSGYIRCHGCRGVLEPSGVEVHRFVCRDCRRHYQAVLHFVELPVADSNPALLSDAVGDPSSIAGD